MAALDHVHTSGAGHHAEATAAPGAIAVRRPAATATATATNAGDRDDAHVVVMDRLTEDPFDLQHVARSIHQLHDINAIVPLHLWVLSVHLTHRFQLCRTW